jgi:hypothetical protein
LSPIFIAISCTLIDLTKIFRQRKEFTCFSDEQNQFKYYAHIAGGTATDRGCNWWQQQASHEEPEFFSLREELCKKKNLFSLYINISHKAVDEMIIRTVRRDVSLLQWTAKS